jgi:hypothetical protein
MPDPITNTAPPNTIHQGGPFVLINESDFENSNVLSAVASPGMLMEQFDNAGDTQWRPNSSADNLARVCVLIEDVVNNKGTGDDYAIGDLPRIHEYQNSGRFQGIAVSGITVNRRTKLQSNGDGKLKLATLPTAAANVAFFESLKDYGLLAADTLVEVQVVNL